MGIDYFFESERYRPDVVIELLIAEAPPPSGTKYFYVPKQMINSKSIEKDTSLPATIFYHYFKCRPETEQEYADMLERSIDSLFYPHCFENRIICIRIKARLEFREKLSGNARDVPDARHGQ